ncbi:Protein SLG1 [Emydomyces testavorans]|uniref:Protein SLG1 n=1 Tax=Emydomyces testavorans TaxID=2070801 RepID=A0AAF0DKQ9_9EURO|nr:Protein SLG1 [Emydomyces testavorans]
MKTLSAAAVAVSILLDYGLVAASPGPAPSDVPINKSTYKGCYSSSGSMEDQGAYTFQSTGYCRDLCTSLKRAVMGLTMGSNCYCGDKLPPASAKTDDRITDTVETDDKSASPSSSSTTPPMQTITQSGQTVVVTTGGDAPKKDQGPNKAGIAAGVVVGVVVLAAIVGGVFFFLKYKKRKEVMEEYRRNATISNFVSGGKPYSESSKSDSRLDPTLMSQRRQSNGSIADDQDFSRRILKVTNPDSQY